MMNQSQKINYKNKMGLGFMRFSPYDFLKIKKLINQAFSLGVSYIETCNFYIDGNCEQLVAKALKEYPREQYNLAAKFCFRGDLSNYNFKEYLANQLNTFQTDFIDYYAFQALDRTLWIDDSNLKPEFYDFYNFLKTQKETGVVRNIGFSFHDTPKYLNFLLRNFKWDFVQLQLNYYDWYMGYAKDLYFLTEEYKVPVVVMGALKGGMLGEKNNIPPYLSYSFLSLLPNIKVILSGTTDISQMMENNQLINFPKPLSKRELNAIRKIALADTSILCTNCQYCKNHCSQNLDIYKIFQKYNEDIKEKQGTDFLNFINENNDSALHCIGCRQCEKYCPQHLPIADLMQDRIFRLRL